MNRVLRTFVLVSPSGGGKSSLIFSLLQRHCAQLALAVSHTTRPARRDEHHGEHYYFCSDDEFQRLVTRQDFIEWAQVHHHSYGTTFQEIHRIHAQRKSVILDIDIQGWLQIRDRLSPVESVFILPPSFAEMKRRLMVRQSESKLSLLKRFESSLDEISQMQECSYYMINDEFDDSAHQLEQWMIHGRYNQFCPKTAAMAIGEQMTQDISAYLRVQQSLDQPKRVEPSLDHDLSHCKVEGE